MIALLLAFKVNAAAGIGKPFKEYLNMAKGKTTKIGRSARTGKFMPVKQAQKHKSTAVVETIKRPNK